jgi:hypothetical protein
MGFCTPAEHKRFLSLCPQIEQYIIEAKRSLKGRYNDQAGLRGMKFVAQRY